MCKILEFKPKMENEASEGYTYSAKAIIEGYTYFAKAIIDSLCEGEPNEQDIKIQISDKFGRIHDVEGASLMDGVITLQSL